LDDEVFSDHFDFGHFFFDYFSEELFLESLGSDREVDDRDSDEDLRQIVGVLQFGGEIHPEILVEFEVGIAEFDYLPVVDDGELLGQQGL